MQDRSIAVVEKEDGLFRGMNRIRVRAILVADRIDYGVLDLSERIAGSPLVIRAGERGCAVIFRYGVVVLFGMQPIEEAAFLAELRKLVSDVQEHPTEESAEIVISPETDERVENGLIRLKAATVERIQLVADPLAESAVLEHYERLVAATFDRIEPLAASLERTGKARPRSRELLRRIGEALQIEQKTVGRIEVGEKPDVLWDHVELEPLYARLSSEFELRERQLALNRKLELISRTVGTVLDLLHHRRNLRVEWYIVLLIVVEILLTLYEMFLGA